MKEESMSRTFGLAAAVVAAMLFFVLAGPGSAAPKKLAGTVGPGYTISLKFGGKSATTLKAGRYRLLVSDRSPIHDFHITGPGVNKVVTSVPFTGTKIRAPCAETGRLHLRVRPARERDARNVSGRLTSRPPPELP
jgi:hypothetical protein